MPTYDYRCDNGHVFEVFHGIKDDTPRTCPECGAAAKRVPGAGSGVLFRGSGFYATDYRSRSYREAAKSESAGRPESAPKPPEPKKPGGDAGGAKGD